MKRFLTPLAALIMLLGIGVAGPAGASAPVEPDGTMVCEQTVYAPAILEAGSRDQIVYGVKWWCSIRPSMMFVEAQAKNRVGVYPNYSYQDYGSPVTYQCGYGGYGSCKSTYTIFDWTYCSKSNYYRTQGTTEAFWQTWGGTGPVSVPSQGGKWIDCTGHRVPNTPEEQKTIDAFKAWMTDQSLGAVSGITDPDMIPAPNGHSVKAGNL